LQVENDDLRQQLAAAHEQVQRLSTLPTDNDDLIQRVEEALEEVRRNEEAKRLANP
jgi:hypothetical protein